MVNKNISAIILAAGQGTRMGKQKMLLPWGEATILEQVIYNVLASGVHEVIVVLGYKAGEMKERLANNPGKVIEGHKIKIAINPGFREGMSGSLIRGLESTGKDSRAFMVVLGDQPQIGPGIIKKILQAFLPGDKSIILPTFKGRRGHPIIMDMKYKPQILNLKGDTGARELIKSHPEEVLEVDISSQEILQDIDTWQDYEEIRVVSHA